MQQSSVTVTVSERLSHSLGNRLCDFDCAHDEFSIVDPAFLPSAINDDSSFSLVPTDVVLHALAISNAVELTSIRAVARRN